MKNPDLCLLMVLPRLSKSFLICAVLLSLQVHCDARDSGPVAERFVNAATPEGSQSLPGPDPGNAKDSQFLPPDDLGPASLPDWFTGNRVHLHWEGNLSIAEEEDAVDGRYARWMNDVQKTILEMGAKVWVGLARRGAEGAWWKSDVGEMHPLAGDSELFTNHVIEPARARGLRFVAYYRHDIDLAAQEAHPEWRALDARGKPYQSYRQDNALHLSYFSPYKDFLKKRLVELAARGADGIYFDSFHMHPVDTSVFAREAFEKRYGRPLPESLDPSSQDFVDMARLTAEQLRLVFGEWKDAVREVNPGIVFIAGAAPMVEFSALEHSERMPEVIDSQKIEFQKCFGGQQHYPQAPINQLVASRPGTWLPPRSLQESVAWRIARDVAFGRPAHIWNFQPSSDYGETMHTNLAIVASGNISSAHVDFTAPQAYPPLFEMSRELGEAFQGMEPCGQVALHASSALLESAWVAPDEAASYQQRFDRLYAPVLGAAQALEQSHRPFRMTFDSHLRDGFLPEGITVILTPERAGLPDDIRNRLNALEERGVRIIDLSTMGPWHQASQLPGLQEKLLAEIRQTLPETAPFRIEAGPGIRSQVFQNPQNGQYLITLVRDWNDFWFFGDDTGRRRTDLPEQPPAPPTKLVINTPGRKLESVRLIDHKPYDNPEIWKDGLGVTLPPFDIYQFILIQTRQEDLAGNGDRKPNP